MLGVTPSIDRTRPVVEALLGRQPVSDVPLCASSGRSALLLGHTRHHPPQLLPSRSRRRVEDAGGPAAARCRAPRVPSLTRPRQITCRPGSSGPTKGIRCPDPQRSSYFSQETWIEPTNSYILNCGDSALLTATRTLRTRRAITGARATLSSWRGSPHRTWSSATARAGRTRRRRFRLRSGHRIGARASGSCVRDRGRAVLRRPVREAEAGFTSIGHDPSSPWHGMGPYLAARAMIRQATMGGKDASGDPAAAARAREALKAIIADPAQAGMRPPLKGCWSIWRRGRIRPPRWRRLHARSRRRSRTLTSSRDASRTFAS